MFAYCGNNPVCYKDPFGLFFEEIREMLEGIYEQMENFFGAGAETEHQVESEYEHISDPFNWLFSAKTGNRITKQIDSIGTFDNPVSFYAKGRSDNYLLSSAGVQLNL